MNDVEYKNYGGTRWRRRVNSTVNQLRWHLSVIYIKISCLYSKSTEFCRGGTLTYMSLDTSFRQTSESMRKASKKTMKTTPEENVVSGGLTDASPGMEPHII